jgi:hypothetical protein
MSSVPVMVSDGRRRVCGRKRGREDKCGRAERDRRNSKSAKSHGNSLSCWAAQQRRGNTPLRTERYVTPHDEAAKPSRQWGELPIVLTVLIAAWPVLSWALAPPMPVRLAHPSLTGRTVIPDTRQRSRFRKHALPTFGEHARRRPLSLSFRPRH